MPEPTPATAGVKPWRLQLICCGRDDGTFGFDTDAEAEAFRAVYTDPKSGHERVAILTGRDEHDRDPADALTEYLAAISGVTGFVELCDRAQAVLRRLAADRDQLRARLDRIGMRETETQWAAIYDGRQERITEWQASGAAEWAPGYQLVSRPVVPIGNWRPADPPTRVNLPAGDDTKETPA